MPEEIGFETEPEIALGLIRRALEEDVPAGVVLADAAYGSDTKFREGVAGLGLADVVGVQASLSVWRPGEAPLPPRPRQAVGRPPKLLPRSAERKPVLVRELVREAGEKAFRTVRWRQGGQSGASHAYGRFRCGRRTGTRWRSEPYAEHWLLAEWPRGAQEPARYWLSNLPAGDSA